MKQRKNIDEIYREKLRDAESLPPADSWEYISARLPKKKSRRLPLWLKLGGVAAFLALLVSLFTFDPFQVSNQQENSVTDGEKEEPVSPESTSTAFEESRTEDEDSGSAGEQENKGISSEIPLRYGVVSSSEEISKKENSSRTSKTTPAAIALEDVRQKRQTEEPRERISGITKDNQVQENIAAAEGLPISGSELQSAAIATATIPEEAQRHTEAEALTELRMTSPAEPADEASEKAAFLKRFRLSTTAAAVYFDHLGSGNTLDASLANNPSGGEVSMSYGINLAYRLTEKVQLRSGLNRVNLNYNTRGVNYATVQSSQAIDQHVLESGTILATARGSLDQELGFLEVPVEVQYSLLDKRIGVDLIGGFSTLFLEDNNLSLNASGLTTDLGPAQNLNDLSFSANVGVGLHYRLTPQFRINLEPIFKYQFNTFNNLPGLSPYYFGVYSGISFGF